jgi:hypothetical protein
MEIPLNPVFWSFHVGQTKQVKVRLSPYLTKHHAMKTYRESGVVSFTPRPLYTKRKSPWYPLDRRLAGFQYRSGHGGEEKNSQPLPGIEP